MDMPGGGRSPNTDAVLTIAPPPEFSIAGISCFMQSATPRRLTPRSLVNHLFRHVRDRTPVEQHAGIVEGDVETAEMLDRPLRPAPAISSSRLTSALTNRPLPPAFSICSIDPAPVFLAAAGDDNMCSLRGEGEGGRSPDAGGSASDQNNFVFECFHVMWCAGMYLHALCQMGFINERLWPKMACNESMAEKSGANSRTFN